MLEWKRVEYKKVDPFNEAMARNMTDDELQRLKNYSVNAGEELLKRIPDDFNEDPDFTSCEECADLEYEIDRLQEKIEELESEVEELQP